MNGSSHKNDSAAPYGSALTNLDQSAANTNATATTSSPNEYLAVNVYDIDNNHHSRIFLSDNKTAVITPATSIQRIGDSHSFKVTQTDDPFEDNQDSQQTTVTRTVSLGQNQQWGRNIRMRDTDKVLREGRLSVYMDDDLFGKQPDTWHTGFISWPDDREQLLSSIHGPPASEILELQDTEMYTS
nr:uncharacterized protein CI109_003912 [Kwoniella shandongensis]KAA5527653.1 hypothetical protein CI109_003912 [Kwoniella shandongensis]